MDFVTSQPGRTIATGFGSRRHLAYCRHWSGSRLCQDTESNLGCWVMGLLGAQGVRWRKTAGFSSRDPSSSVEEGEIS